MPSNDHTEPDVLARVLEETLRQGERMDRMENTLRAIRADLNVASQMLQDFGLRLNLVERRQTDTPPPP